MAKKGLWKTAIVIWSDFDPRNMELEDLAQEATGGRACCSLQTAEYVENPEADPNPPGTTMMEVWFDPEVFDDNETKEKEPVYRCTVCSDPVESKDWRDHLYGHNPNADNFSSTQVRNCFVIEDMYRRDLKSDRINTDEKKSRETNQNHPLRLVTGVKQEEGIYYPELECGHTAAEAHIHQDYVSWMIPAKKKKRCPVCTQN